MGIRAILIVTWDLMRIVQVEVACWARVSATHSVLNTTCMLVFISAGQGLNAMLRTVDSSGVDPMCGLSFTHERIARICQLATWHIILLCALLRMTIDQFRVLTVDMVRRAMP